MHKASKESPLKSDTRSLASYLSLDLRALAVWRIALGALVLLDILLRLRDLQTFYGDHGVLSREDFLSHSLLAPLYHLFLSTGSTAGLLVLFGVWAGAAFCLMIGYKSRIAGLITWYFVVSIQLRNPSVLDGGDDLLRLLLFWTPFLPLSARWSWEARTHPQWKNLPNSYRSIATVGVYLQFALLYLFAALLKTGEDWRVTGDALYYTLSIDQFTTRLGQFLVQFPDHLRTLTWAALGLEFLLPILLLLPLRVPMARGLFLFFAVSFHLAIAFLLHFGIFMAIAIFALTVFIPGPWLDRWETWCQEDGTEESQGSPPVAYELAIPTQAFCAFICFYILVVNFNSLTHHQRLPGWTKTVAMVTYQHQHWHFFAPNPFREDGWFVFEVLDSEGNLHDLFSERAYTLDKPELGSARFPNQRWRRWLQNSVQIMVADRDQWYRSTLDYLRKKWQRDHPELEAEKIRLLFIQETTPPPGETATTQMKVLAQWERKEASSVYDKADGSGSRRGSRMNMEDQDRDSMLDFP